MQSSQIWKTSDGSWKKKGKKKPQAIKQSKAKLKALKKKLGL